MYTIALADCPWLVVAVIVCVPMLVGGKYKPLLLIVPEAVDPPGMPSTDHVAFELAVNCWFIVKVKTAARGVTPNPVPVPDKLTCCGLPGALSVIASIAPRWPVSIGVNVTLIVQVPFGATIAP